ncbi:VOC family protein [Kaistia dalseonensis]|uniref:Catechol 2,3-dioxygenase n=1 Tax=Kaistia dalseonensis TaxID=410840 RepID=A0ABU0H644_9HYPH|nr:VOC family protein [Kaistia dalseonensis]MCX5495176.1 VOC family protein [Kaistia dalseonensis]MDQ0437760.1 catechol 2,3-dioxygenase [Kaistia dalseonensis]
MSDPIVAEHALPFALTRPIHVAEVGLKAHDVEKVADYYRAVLGLETIFTGGGRIALGAGGKVLLDIAPLPPGGLADDPRSAGLFHTAFLMPTRADLARWIVHAAGKRFPVDGMADHLVSEAFYLTDPEGNGVEIYSDRPQRDWGWDGKSVRMATDPLDVDAIVRAGGNPPPPQAGAPEGLSIGHVHLRVGDAGPAGEWWTSVVGLDETARMRGASFLSSGGYHHHIAANSWQSRGAGQRDPKRSGLAYVMLTGSGVTTERELVDPWGTVIRMTPGA